MFSDPRLVVLLSALFVGLGIINFVLGQKRAQQAKAAGRSLPWYRQLGILTAIEYVLLALVLLLHLGASSHVLPQDLDALVTPLYIIVLIIAAIVLFVMLFFGLRDRNRSRPAQPAVATTATVLTTAEFDERRITPEQKQK